MATTISVASALIRSWFLLGAHRAYTVAATFTLDTRQYSKNNRWTRDLVLFTLFHSLREINEIHFFQARLNVCADAALIACGGGGDAASTGTPTAPTSTSLTVTGTAATGLAIAGATVTGKCKVGTGTATTGVDAPLG